MQNKALRFLGSGVKARVGWEKAALAPPSSPGLLQGNAKSKVGALALNLSSVR